MTKEERIEMARQAGFLTNEIKSYAISPYKDEDHNLIKELETFAKLVAEKSKQEQGESNNSEYERGFIDGMQKQMQSSVDKAVRNMQNKLTQEWEVLQSIKRHTITTQDEIQTAILRVCKVANHDADFNVVGFHSFCNKLIGLGAEKEREEILDLVDGYAKNNTDLVEAIRARGQE